jgi:DNA invertase Pin-like site-specific DNA recombinase
MGPNPSTAGQPHEGKFVAYVRVSTSKQETERDKKDIIDFLNGGEHTVEWFEEKISGTVHPDERPVLQECMDYAKKEKATIIVSSISRLFRTMWHGLQYFEQHVETGKVNLIVCDDPMLSANPRQNKLVLAIKAAMAQDMRDKIALNTKTALGRINEKIEEEGHYYTRAGKKINKLGVHENMEQSREAAREVNIDKADIFAERMRPIIVDLVQQGYSLRQMADFLNNHKDMYKTRRGGKWGSGNLHNLVNRIFKGERK